MVPLWSARWGFAEALAARKGRMVKKRNGSAIFLLFFLTLALAVPGLAKIDGDGFMIGIREPTLPEIRIIGM